MKNALYKLSIFTIASGFIMVGVTAYWLFYPYKILSFNEGNGTVLNKTVLQGGYVEIRQNNCKFKDLHSHIDRQFIDSIVYQVPPTTNKRPIGCSDKTEMVYVPRALAPGVYYISTNISFKVNPIRTVTYTVKTDTFTVVSKK